MAELLFYLLSFAAIAFGIGVVMAKMPLFSVLSLLGTFFCLAGIYLLAGFQFLAATQLLVYAGAIMVLFLFVIMLLNLGDEEELARNTGLALTKRGLAIAGFAAGVLALVGMVAVSWAPQFGGDAGKGDKKLDDLTGIAEVLFSRYMLPFEAASLLLLATMIAVIALAKRQRAKGTDDEELGWPWQRGVEQ